MTFQIFFGGFLKPKRVLYFCTDESFRTYLFSKDNCLSCRAVRFRACTFSRVRVTVILFYFTDYKRLEVKTFSQLEKDAILVAYESKVLFVDIMGKKLHVQNKLTELSFDYPVESAGLFWFLSTPLLNFSQHFKYLPDKILKFSKYNFHAEGAWEFISFL